MFHRWSLLSGIACLYVANVVAFTLVPVMSHSKNKKNKKGTGEVILCFQMNPATSNELALRQSIQNAMEQTFGLTRAYTYFDIVEILSSGSEVKIKVADM